MMKYIGTTIVVALVTFCFYAVLGSGSCSRIERGALLAKWGVDGFAKVAAPWVTESSKKGFKGDALSWQVSMASFLKTQFYSDVPDLACEWEKYIPKE